MLDFIHKLFRGAAASAAWQPTPPPTPEQARRQARWEHERVYRNWLGPYYKAYHLRKGGVGGRRGYRVELLREAGRQGALFFYDPSIGPGNFGHLFRLLGARLTGLGYQRACHDQRQRRHQQLREVVEKQLFKPHPTTDPASGLCNQRFGLLTLDLVRVNDRPLFLRLTANPVLEPHFTAPLPFEQLLREVFDEPAADEFVRGRIQAYYREA